MASGCWQWADGGSALLPRGIALIRRKPWQVLLLTILVVLCFSAIVAHDWSDRLTSEQTMLVRAFVVRTNALPVQNVHAELTRKGYLTVRNAQAILEVAKAQNPGYGLISAYGDIPSDR